MQVARKAEYALRAVLELALREAEGPCRIADIAEAQGVPHRFLEAIVNQLRHAGITQSVRGAEGGYLLARPAEEISAKEVIEAIQGPLTLVPCGAGGDPCDSDPRCPFVPMWQRARMALEGVLSDASIAEARDRARASRRTESWCYAI
jgi:Rrf2 family transcriptional regulator, cysteine metabolism repressor